MIWHIKENPTSYAIRNDKTTVAYVNKSQGDWEHAESNARLIVEAPMMHEIIDDFITVLTTDPGPLDVQNRIDGHVKIAQALIDRIDRGTK